ncbi:MAG: hypothetical protein ACRCY3_01055 [Sphingorhabdus sp.]
MESVNRNSAKAIAFARHIRTVRREAMMALAPKLMATPAWDILLELFSEPQVETSGSIGSLSIGDLADRTGLPISTIFRWAQILSDKQVLTSKIGIDEVSLADSAVAKLSDLLSSSI